jgi:hypothetical protein
MCRIKCVDLHTRRASGDRSAPSSSIFPQVTCGKCLLTCARISCVETSMMMLTPPKLHTCASRRHSRCVTLPAPLMTCANFVSSVPGILNRTLRKVVHGGIVYCRLTRTMVCEDCTCRPRSERPGLGRKATLCSDAKSSTSCRSVKSCSSASAHRLPVPHSS